MARPMRRRRGIGGLLALVLFLVAVGTAAAAEFRGGDEPGVPAGQRVDDDLYLAGGQVALLGTVTRDALVAAGDLELGIGGRVEGNLIAAVGRADLRGQVGRSVRVLGGDVQVFGRVGGDLLVAGGTVKVEPGATVAGDVLVAGGEVEIRGEVGGDLRVSGGSLRLTGRVAGDARVQAGEIELGRTARIDGRLRYASDGDPELDPAATVGGGIEELDTGADAFSARALSGGLAGAVLRLLCALVAGAAVVLAAPRAAAAVADGARRRPLPSLLLGLALLVAVPVALTVLLITVIGIPLALIGWALFFAALYLSQVVVGLAIGRAVLPRSWGAGGRGYNLLAMTLGVILLGALRLVPVPWLGGAVAALTAVVGLGAVVVGPRLGRGARV